MTSRTRNFVLIGLLLSFVLAGVVSYYASSQPDGLNRVAIDEGLDKSEKAHPVDDSPLAGYEVKGVNNDRLSGGLAGVAGVVLVFAIGAVLTRVLRRRDTDQGSSETVPTESTRTGGGPG